MRLHRGLMLALVGALALTSACASMRAKKHLSENKGGQELKAPDIQKLAMAAEGVFQAAGYTVQTSPFPQGPGKDGFVVQGTKDVDVTPDTTVKGADKSKTVVQHADHVFAYFWHKWNAGGTDAEPGVVLYYIDGEMYDLTESGKKLNPRNLTLTQSADFRDKIMASLH